MSKLIRYWHPGNTVFVTTVTKERQSVLIANIDLMNAAINQAQKETGFEQLAWVIMPDHYHAILRTDLASVSTVLQSIKMSFGAHYRKRYGFRSGKVWQRRFWDHVIRDTQDLERHVDYIHYNPVKHGLVSRAIEYEHSSFRQFVTAGLYDEDWGQQDQDSDSDGFGE